MTFDSIARRLGVEEYPEELRALYENEKDRDVIAPAEIERLDREYGLLGSFLAPALEAREQLKSRPDHCAWIVTATEYVRRSDVTAVKKLPLPPTDETLAGDLLPLFILLPLMEEGIAAYRARFSGEAARRMICSLPGSLAAVSRCKGRPSLSKSHFNWNALYLKGVLFYQSGFQFELSALGTHVRILQNTATGEMAILMGEGRLISRVGRVLNDSQESEAAFITSFEESDTAYIAHPVEAIRVLPEKKTFLKAEWKGLVMPGDAVLKLHIPRGADLTDASVEKAIADGLARAQEVFSENVRGVVCHTWLFDPALAEALPPTSRILSFASHFLRYPAKSLGNEVFSFVFQKTNGPLEELPENTGLQRALKQKYLAGGAIYAYSGLYVPKQ